MSNSIIIKDDESKPKDQTLILPHSEPYKQTVCDQHHSITFNPNCYQSEKILEVTPNNGQNSKPSPYRMPNQESYQANRKINDRRAFIRKVYALLSIQLVFTSIVVGIVVAVPELSEGIKHTTGLVIAAIIITLILIIGIMCFKKVARKYPINYIALLTFTIFESYIVAYVCAFYDPYIVLCSAIIALTVAFALTIYAWKTKSDFTVCGGVLVGVTTSLLFFGFFMIFFHNTYAKLIFCEIAIILYSVFIVYDTQLIAGGRYQEISYDDYVIGAVILYVDIVGLFLYILSLFGSKT